jgi:hypothetical protein
VDIPEQSDAMYLAQNSCTDAAVHKTCAGAVKGQAIARDGRGAGQGGPALALKLKVEI